MDWETKIATKGITGQPLKIEYGLGIRQEYLCHITRPDLGNCAMITEEDVLDFRGETQGST